MIESEKKAFQSPLKYNYLTFRGQLSSRESRTYFNMIQPILSETLMSDDECEHYGH